MPHDSAAVSVSPLHLNKKTGDPVNSGIAILFISGALNAIVRPHIHGLRRPQREEDDFMKRTILATCLAGACAVVLSAQTPTQQPPTSTAGTTGAASQDTSQGNQRGRLPMTISGCLKAGDTAGTYMLTNVKGMGRPAGTTGDTTTAPGTTAGAPTTAPESGQTRGMNQVLLMAGSGVDFTPHVGHQIEVTGTPARGGQGTGTTTGAATTTGAGTTTGAAGTATGGTTAGSTTTATTGQGNRGGVRSLNVTSIKMIAETCSEK
jgi:hypothetical protein